jgi:hypothetical protein
MNAGWSAGFDQALKRGESKVRCPIRAAAAQKGNILSLLSKNVESSHSTRFVWAFARLEIRLTARNERCPRQPFDEL